MNTRKALLVALSMGVLDVVALAYPVHRHVVGAFSDFYVRFAPDADRIAARRTASTRHISAISVTSVLGARRW